MLALIGLIVVLLAVLFVISAIFNIAFGLLLPIIIWALVGWLAGQVVRGRGYGLLGNVLLGIGGGILGNFLWGLLNLPFGAGAVSAIISGTIGAILLVYVWRFFSRDGRARRVV